jgi:hypothetical protein
MFRKLHLPAAQQSKEELVHEGLDDIAARGRAFMAGAVSSDPVWGLTVSLPHQYQRVQTGR